MGINTGFNTIDFVSIRFGLAAIRIDFDWGYTKHDLNGATKQFDASHAGFLLSNLSVGIDFTTYFWTGFYSLSLRFDAELMQAIDQSPQIDSSMLQSLNFGLSKNRCRMNKLGNSHRYEIYGYNICAFRLLIITPKFLHSMESVLEFSLFSTASTFLMEFTNK